MLSLAAQSLALYGTQEALSNCFLGGWMNGWLCVRVDEEAVQWEPIGTRKWSCESWASKFLPLCGP